ncbi:MAG: TonB-dependent receptor plug domain-containing protein, partial [Bacteroidetes bacterium]|nr:TonB-dependent receptor plug domain-containing protein [Bacteroidota bacterium]
MTKHYSFKLWFLIALLSGITASAFAQEKYTVSGYIQDAETGEKLINARIYDTKSLKGAITNNYGFYSLTLEAGSVELKASYPGYQSVAQTVELNKDQTITFDLGHFEVDAVEIVAEQEERIEEKTEMSTIDISVDQIKSLPALLGEVDVVKAIQLMPGVQSGSEGTTGLYVRGGGPDQNLILLDGVPLYYVSHLGGFFSVFNADALSSVKMVKGGFPARYGGRLSSVLDVRMKEGNLNEFHGEGSIGIISSKLSLQGPIVKGKTSFIVSGRRTYLDLLSRPISRAASRGNSAFGYFFHDLNGKVNHTFSDKDRLYFSFYIGDDQLDVKEGFKYGKPGDSNYNMNEFKSKLGWGNDLAALRWNHIWGPKLFSNLTATFSHYKLRVRYDERSEYTEQDSIIKNNSFFEYQSGIRDWSGRLDFDYYPSPAHDIKFGFGTIFHKFSPGSIGFQLSNVTNQDTTLKSKIHNTIESSVYIEDNIKIGKRFSANIGARGVQYFVNDKT